MVGDVISGDRVPVHYAAQQAYRVPAKSYTEPEAILAADRPDG